MSAKDMTKRLLSLELKYMPQPQGRLVVITFDSHCSAEDHERGIAEAESAAGENGLIIVVQYDKAEFPAWWGPEQHAMMAADPRRPPYEMTVNDDRQGKYL